MAHPLPHTVPPRTWVICLTAGLALAVAMGIGRFAFTPLLPLMHAEGLVDDRGGAWLAAANYLGYLLGALTAAWLPVRPRTQVLVSLLATAALTAGIAVLPGMHGWIAMRLAAGVVSAWTLVAASSWAVSTLALRHRSDAAGGVFAGVGLGIAGAGAWVWWHADQGAPALWQQLGWIALAVTVLVACCWPRSELQTAQRPSGEAAPAMPVERDTLLMVLCYGTLGFGYILPATYLPAVARELIGDPRQFGLVWPVFGLAAACSTLLAGRALRRWSGRQIWATSHVLMALGCALPLFSRSGIAITGAALLVGGTFMVATMTGLQEARHAMPGNPAPLLARMTTAFALGQIAGPLLALAFSRVPSQWLGLTGVPLAQALAVALLLASARWLYRFPSHSEHAHDIHPTRSPH